ELVMDQQSNKPASELTASLVKAAADSGLILLPCGTNANVIRFLPPLTASDAIVSEGMDIFERCLVSLVQRKAA
ncbi:aminotransferase class III-fold pyridoxal phosphate-dependent enzyme, partial [Microbacteriaceae bacterium K1510]|nr:aminotransferase class III-fold pyridoxal phosphate-dependent enzyme [Microbacteriaceae bacterium K1510]